MTLQRFKKVAAIAATLALFPIAGQANITSPFGSVGANTPLGGFGLNTPFGGANVNTPFGGFGLNTPFGGINVAGFNLHGGGAAGAPASGQSSAVRCSFGSELLLASTVDSCENSGGKVDPALLSYRIPCNVGGSVVMAPSQAVCARLDGKPAQ